MTKLTLILTVNHPHDS